MAKGWPSCLQVMDAIVLLISEVAKLILVQYLTVYTPHTVVSFLNTKGGLWISDSLLLEVLAVQITTCPTLNPASFLPEEDKELLYECEQVTLQSYAAREDLKETPLDNPDLVLFINGSSYVEQETRKAKYAIISLNETVDS